MAKNHGQKQKPLDFFWKKSHFLAQKFPKRDLQIGIRSEAYRFKIGKSIYVPMSGSILEQIPTFVQKTACENWLFFCKFGVVFEEVPGVIEYPLLCGSRGKKISHIRNSEFILHFLKTWEKQRWSRKVKNNYVPHFRIQKHSTISNIPDAQ